MAWRDKTADYRIIPRYIKWAATTTFVNMALNVFREPRPDYLPPIVIKDFIANWTGATGLYLDAMYFWAVATISFPFVLILLIWYDGTKRNLAGPK